MTINHRAVAVERLRASDYQRQEGDLKGARLEVSAALVHATLARDEEQGAIRADMRDALTLLRRRETAIRKLIAAHVVESLVSTDPARTRAAHRLVRDLYEADASVDDLLNEQLPKVDWSSATAAPVDDPWAPDPQIQKLQDFRRVVAGHLAEAFIDRKSLEVRTWARGLVNELREVGIDLGDEITDVMRRHTVGDVPSEPPF